jgi:hypothetical protein
MTTAAEGGLERFCRQIEERSREHEEAMPIAVAHGWWSLAVGMLRQELDSLIRVIFLLRQPPRIRDQIIESSLTGDGRFRLLTPKGKLATVTDSEMVGATDGLADLDGWTRLVYEFGCSFIHLSSAHDYLARDPFQALAVEERQVIADYLRNYHGGLVDTRSTFNDVTVYVPSVLRKISSRLRPISISSDRV